MLILELGKPSSRDETLPYSHWNQGALKDLDWGLSERRVTSFPECFSLSLSPLLCQTLSHNPNSLLCLPTGHLRQAEIQPDMISGMCHLPTK